MNLDYIALGLVFFSVIIIILGIVKIHTYPGKVAKARNHPQTEAIEVTSLLGLIMFPLWMAALVWAYSGAVVGVLYETGEPAGPDDPPGDDEASVETDAPIKDVDQQPGGAA